MKLNNKNIVFIGMPSAGKSYWGRKLSKKYNINFIDGDIIIEKIYGKKLGDILKDLGEKGFCEYEETVLCNLSCRNTIISPGGSVIYSDKIMKHFRKINSIIIYLFVDIQTLRERLGDLKKRGVVIKPGMTFQDLFYERNALYHKYCDIMVDCRKKTKQEIFKELSTIIFNKTKSKL